MSEEESEIFHGDRPPELGEKAKSSAKSKPRTIVAKADPATVGQDELPDTDEHADPEADELIAPDDIEAAAAEASAPVEPEYHFEIDPESLWTMPPAMQERMSGLASFAAVTNQRLDDQEKATARLIKTLKQLA
jgi:hypothetical protein